MSLTHLDQAEAYKLGGDLKVVKFKKKNMLFKKKKIFILFFLITFFIFNLRASAAYFNYADFDFDKFAEENKTYWTGMCSGATTESEEEKCVELVLSKQRQFYTRLYKLLTKYQKSGYFIDDNIIIATVFYGLTPDLFTDNGDLYKKTINEKESAYNYDENLDIDNYDVNAEPSYDYFKNETETLEVLLKNMFAYMSVCYGIYGEVTEVQGEDGTIIQSCISGGFPTTINGSYVCASTADSKYFGFWEYMAEKSGVNSFFGLTNSSREHCRALGVQYSGGTVYDMQNKKQGPPSTLNKYWEFLETSTYFDNKAHLKNYFNYILEETNYKDMKEFHEKAPNNLKEEYSDELILIRKSIVRGIKSVLETQGTNASNVNLMSLNNSLYWWPIGGSELTSDGSGKEYAFGEPTTIKISSFYGLRMHPVTLEENSFHKGIDIAGPIGTHIIAARAGIVEQVVVNCISGGDHSCGGRYGNYIIISHGDGNHTLYAHLHEDTIMVSVGESVNQGQLIGKMGSSGRATGSHLHFEIRIGSNSANGVVDPLTYISAENPRAAAFSTNLVEGDTNQETLCRTLLSSGYSVNGTIALMVNAKAESGFNPLIDGDLINGVYTSYGLFQWHDTRKNNLITMFPGNYSNIDSQVSFLKYELENGYFNLYDSLLIGSSATDTLSYNFCYEFERPANKETTCLTRTNNYLKEMSNYVNNNCQ